ncbi:hypothetical protein BH10PSE14_BH10PSE14_04400 [soil metagenome]
MTEPLDLVTVQRHLRLTDDQVDESYVGGLVVAARRVCELQTGRALIGRTVSRTLDAFPTSGPAFPYPIPVEVAQPDALDILLPGGAVSAITAFTYRDGSGTTQTVDPASYISDFTQEPGRLGPVAAWPVAGPQPGAIRISYTVVPMDPDDLQVAIQAQLLLIGHWFANPEAVAIDVRGIPVEAPLAVTWLIGSLRKFATS